jgi:RNA polymerase sigma-70 factor (ECF subfamily)
MYYKAMFNSALRITQDSNEAEDVMQEAFLSAFTKLHTFKGEVPFGAWLKRIVINRSLTQVKRNSKFQEVNLEVVSYKLEDDSAGDGLSEVDLTNTKVQQVVSAMNMLKENYRVILNLSLIEGYDNEEVSRIMGISNQNCRTTISRAKSKLRKILMESSVPN